MTLPFPAAMVVLTMFFLVPAGMYAWAGIRDWQMGGSPAAALTERFFWGIAFGRTVGAMLLAILLLYCRRPAAVAVTITAVWLAGPPLDFLWVGIVVLAVSAGQASWGGGDMLGWIARVSLLPSVVTAALLIPRSVRRAFGIK
jgi:hypothetical protein